MSAVHRLAETLRVPAAPVTAANGTVTAINTAAHTVTVTVGADTLISPYLAMAVLPVLGDIVRIHFTGGSPLVMGVIPGATAAP